MGRRREALPLQKVTLNLFHGDFDFLQSAHSRLGAGKVIRELIHNHIRTVKERASLQHKALPDE